ncbi:MAG: methionine--tRNA ligase [Thermoplasmata archaeon]|nr:MAG: methionine--tRNA ligase [Thermoplasmata archaeon]RLF53258.1 MAG: methionine--tRNA ligase [Thermoplasmata archaeon]
MKKKIYIGVAWPYANGSLHLGHIAGCYLPADIFARYNRMKGRDVLMVSGSDEHGTPITITAENEKTTPQDIVDKYNKEHTENMKQMGISFDLFTRTTTKNHEKVVQDIFLTLYNKGYIYKKNVKAFYCNHCNRFLPDRYIEGTCPYCGNEKARGDQCDECGKMLDPEELKNVKCKICGGTPEIKVSEHLFFALSKFESKLKKWIKKNKHWKSSVLKFTENWLKEGLKDRAITRDINWGIKVPVDGFEDKRIYVWFDAVIGYLSASKEWSQKIGSPDKWVEWWRNKDAKHYYFLAKDNIPFHTLIWPSILMGYDETLNLPYDIPANEYLRLKGEQFSKSRGTAIWIPNILEKFDVDAVRYYLSINMPENKDTSWMWDDFVAKNNDELVGAYGNFVHRVVTFTYKNFGEIPALKELDDFDKEALEKIKETSMKVSEAIEKCSFKKGLRAAMNLAQFGNFYFDQKQPWNLVKNDKEGCGTVLHICLKIVKALAVFMAPYLPFSSDKIWNVLGYKESIHTISWDQCLEDLKAGVELEKPRPLFKKLSLEEIIVPAEEEVFSKLDLRVARVIDVKDHPNADTLYLLNLDVGELGKRVIVAGMKPYYSKDEIKGKSIVIVSNLKPAVIRGVKSNGMLLAAEDENGVCSLLNPGDATPGSKVVIDGIPQEPVNVLEFDDFKKVNMIVDENQKATYKGRILYTEKGDVVSDRPVKKGAKIL